MGYRFDDLSGPVYDEETGEIVAYPVQWQIDVEHDLAADFLIAPGPPSARLRWDLFLAPLVRVRPEGRVVRTQQVGEPKTKLLPPGEP